MIVSGHRNYFYDQKNHYLNETQRISDLMEKAKYKKRAYKLSNKEMKGQMETEVARLEKDIQYFREKVIFKQLIKNIFSFLAKKRMPLVKQILTYLISIRL